MKRRLFLSFVASLVLAPSLLFASDTVDYKPGLIKKELAAGKTVFVDYAADWCSTCRTQERTINVLRSKNPDYDKHITFVRVDWDQYQDSAVSTSRKIPRRSTLLVLRGDKELGRIVAGVSSKQIQALMDKGLPQKS